MSMSPETSALLAEVRAAVEQQRSHPRAWAWRIVERAERGEPVPSCNLRIAQEALGMAELARPERKA